MGPANEHTMASINRMVYARTG